MSENTEIKLDFISSYRGMHDYRIMRYRHPDHGQRVEIQTFVDPLIDPHTGKRQFNYTPEDYDRMVVRKKGYLFRESNSLVPLDLEYARAYNANAKAAYERTKAYFAEKYPDETELEATKPDYCLGTCHLIHIGPGEYDYDWELVPLA